jgi:hypothetical protein
MLSDVGHPIGENGQLQLGHGRSRAAKTTPERSFSESPRFGQSPIAIKPTFFVQDSEAPRLCSPCPPSTEPNTSGGLTLLDQSVHTSWATVREVLKTRQVSTVVLPTINGRCLRIRMGATPDPEVKDLYKRLHAFEQVMTPIRSRNHHWIACAGWQQGPLSQQEAFQPRLD